MNFDEFNKFIFESEDYIQGKASKHLKLKKRSHPNQVELEQTIQQTLTYLYCIYDFFSITRKYKNRDWDIEIPKLPENDEEWNYVFRRLSDKLKTHMNNIECDIYMVEQHSGRKKGRTNE